MPNPPVELKNGIDLQQLRDDLLTQDNRITSHPLFAVQQKRRIYGLEDGDNWEWMYGDEWERALDIQTLEMDAEYEETGECPDGWVRSYYTDIWEFVTACFTEKAAQLYIDINGHNLNEPRIYAYSAYRNAEWIGLRELFMSEDALTARVEALEKAGDALYRRLEDISKDGEAMDQWESLTVKGE